MDREGDEMQAIFSDKDRGELRRKMLDAGWECLLARGYRATKVEDIAREAGIAPGTFYGFFKSKGEFVAQMVAENRRALMADLEAAIERAGGRLGRGGLRAWVRAAWHGERAIFRFIGAADYRKIRENLPEDVCMGPELAGGLLGRVAGSLDGGLPSPDVELAAALQRVCAMTLLERGELDPGVVERTVDALVEATLDALYGREGEGDLR